MRRFGLLLAVFCLFAAHVSVPLKAQEIYKIGFYGNSGNAVCEAGMNIVSMLSDTQNAKAEYIFEPVFFDSADSSAASAVNSTPNLLCVIGMFNSDSAPFLDNVKTIPLFNLDSTYSGFEGRGNGFRMVISEPEAARAMARTQMALFSRSRFGYVYAEGNNDYKETALAYADTVKANKATLAYEKSVESDRTDFELVLMRVRDLKLGNIFFVGGPKQTLEFAKQLEKMKTGAVLCAPSVIFSKEFIKEGKTAAAGAELVMKTAPYISGIKKIKQFVRDYAKKYGKPASVYTPFIHDAFGIIRQGVENGIKTPGEMIGFIGAVEYAGCEGRVKFSAKGARVNAPFYFNVIRRDEFMYMRFQPDMWNAYNRKK